MPIWKKPIDLALLKAANRNTAVEHLGIEFVEVGDDFLRARVPVDQRTIQPFGLLHGGGSVVLAARTRIAAINGTAIGNIAPSQRLYAGGGASIRGFAYQGVGPKDAS
eukprot:gene13676-17336_t